MAASNQPTSFTAQRPAAPDDVISTLLYRLRLNRICIEKDIRVRTAQPKHESQATSNLQSAMFETERLLISTQLLADADSPEQFYVGLQDVLANIVGAEHFALFERDDAGCWPVTAHCGVDEDAISECISSKAFAMAMHSRDVTARSASVTQGPELFVPMLAGKAVAALLVVFEWLPQKRADASRASATVLQMLNIHGGTLLRNVAHASGRER